MTGIIIQARKGSTRLPNKMMLPFSGNESVLDIVISKINKRYQNCKIVLATTTNKKDGELVDVAKRHNIDYYQGDVDNVLSRFIAVGDKYKFDNIIRVCADNPFLDVEHIQNLINEIETGKSDYVSYKNNEGIPVIKTHLGLFTEAVTLAVLKKIAKFTQDKYYFEHVTNFIYSNDSNDFNIKLLSLPEYFKNTESIRLTLDTKADFDLEKRLYMKVKNYSTKKLIAFIKNDESIQQQMKEQIINNTK